MMNPDSPNPEDDRFAALFASAGADAPPADREFLKQLRERSAQVFREAGAGTGSEEAPTTGRRKRMFVIALRMLVLPATAATLVAAVIWSSIAPGGPTALGDVLDRVAEADTLHLEITRDGGTSQVWTSQPGRLRWDEGGGRYRIARHDRLWLVDEAANRAASQASPYFREGRTEIDLLAWLGLPKPESPRRLFAKPPVETVRLDGRQCDLYRIEWPASGGTIRLDALADAGTSRLRSLEAVSIRPDVRKPIGKVQVLAMDEPVDESLFVVGDTLTEDGRIGKVTDTQGIVSVRPVTARRWTPVDRQLVLKPGDWLRTDVRGANAVKARLVRQTDVTLGPGSLVELVRPNRIRLVSGELKLAAEARRPVTLLGPNGQEVVVRDTRLYRLQDEKLVEPRREPIWLAGFEGTTAHDSIGSLVANVEGRNVPLTVGYHKVSVDVRDQIARTVIEESFVNHTRRRLEGVFYFPLPEDASISGFGMWIGDKLVEADVVEKQRAREIYETILRERRDPGLLEWSGGNLFKARVFPIEGRSEKRIKITYTQVLPLKGSRFRYSYGLQSEMLRQNPLRELSIDVKISSAAPLAGVASPTHTTRVRTTRHSAQVQFSAQEYTPTRDFEVVAELAGGQPEVVLIPHRRGDDGYFLLQLQLPEEADGPLRDVLPDGEPLELLILADTSASIDADGRKAQAELVASLLASLGPDDRFNLAACDVECDWALEQPGPPTEENVAAARELLARRVSLGWTDLDKAFASALHRSRANTHVVYVGDGAATGHDVDPVAFSKRLRRLYQGKSAALHAVTVGNTFEPVVLRAMASLGGGSMRRITGEHGPQAVARELLGEITRPAVRDIEVRFQGLRTARVYPDGLPNLPAGSQQILLGRYLPEGRDQVGEVIVTGTRADEPIRFTSRVSLKDAEQGNSFIPRLWARMHLDGLLDQGVSQAIKDEIIALSEEYHIITPYTSLLVLETDEDRERFKVKRRFQMRDGEKFFAVGRENVDLDVLQQQMRRAGDWRIGLRRMVLAQLAALGRDAQPFQPVWDHGRRAGVAVIAGAMGAPAFSSAGPASGPVTRAATEWLGRSNMLGDFAPSDSSRLFDGEDGVVPFGDDVVGEDFVDLDSQSFELQARDRWPAEEKAAAGEIVVGLSVPRGLRGSTRFSADSRMDSYAGYAGDLLMMGNLRKREAVVFAGVQPAGPQRAPSYSQEYTRWLGTLFPHLPPAPSAERPKPPKKPWPAEARRLAQGLLRTKQLASIQGLAIDRRTESFEARLNDLRSRSRLLMLVSPRSWLTRSEGDVSQTTVHWCNGKERGVFSKAFQLGRVRSSEPTDLKKPPLNLSGYVLTSLDQSYQQYDVALKPQGQDQTLLVLKHPSNPGYEVRVLVDTKRQVVLRFENHQDGELTSASAFGDFVEVGGRWWAGRIETTDKEGRRTSVVTQQFQPLAAEAFKGRVDQELAARPRVQFLRQPFVELAAAKGALADGKAAFDDHLALLLHFCRSQQWTRVTEHLKALEQRAEGKPGMRWVRSAILDVSRRREELRKRYVEEAGRLAEAGDAETASQDLFLANYVIDQSARFFPAIEMLPLLDTLEPLHERQEAHVQAMKRWNGRRADYLRNAARAEEALRLRKQLAERYPYDDGLQRAYAQGLVNVREHDAAKAWIKKTLARDFPWHEHEKERLHGVCTSLLESQGRYPELVDYLAAWIKDDPKDQSAYRQYLSALIRADRVDEANAVIGKWLDEARVPGKLAPPVASRLEAAVSQALGQGHNLYMNRLDERWLDPLAETALFFARHEHQLQTANRIMSHYRFRRTDACRRVRKTIAGVLTAEVDQLEPDQIVRLVGWIIPNDPEIEPQAWKRIAAGIQRRWAAEAKPEIRQQLSRPLVQILSSRIGTEEHLAFLRRQWKEGPKEYRASYANELFDALLGQRWSAELEDEAFALLEKVSDADEPAQRLAAQVGALYRLTDRMVRARYDARMKKVEHPEKLTRTELREKQTESLRQARKAFAGRLRREAPKRPASLGRWMTVERLYLEMKLGDKLDAVAAECWELLGPEPPGPVVVDPKRAAEQALSQTLRTRLVVTLLNLAARRSATPALVGRVAEYLDRAIAADPESVGWKAAKFHLLVARDRPEELEKTLRAWTRGDDPDNRWRRSLGYLLAEKGELEEAIELFEAVRAADELSSDDYRTMAGWYLVSGRRRQHREAMISVYKAAEEWRLNNWIGGRLDPWLRRGAPLPTELDQNVIWAFAALFEKSGHPQNYLHRLRDFYQATHDFRLLACLGDAVVGHSAAKVYPFLQGMDSVLSEIRKEATVDSIVEHLAEVRRRATTPVDHRALDLLEALVERRAAELLNQPGPHADQALAALQRAFKRQWSDGEPRLMADLLAHLGRISHVKLADEQVRQLTVLHQRQTRGSLDRLHIGYRLATALWSYSRKDEAVDLLENELAECRSASGGVLPAAANEPLSTFVSYLESLGHHARGEKVLFGELEHPVNRQQGFWLTQRLYELYEHAVRHDGDVSLGRGVDLLRAVERKIQNDLNTDDHGHRYNLIRRLCTVYRAGHDKKLAGVVDGLKAFAFERLPEVLPRQTNNYDSVVRTVADTLHDLAGPREGLAFLVERIENEPVWLRYNNQDAWNRHGYNLARWRTEAKNLGAALEERLLAIVTAELKWDLRSGQSRNRQMYHDHHSHFWSEKRDAFAQAAEEVLAERKQSGATVQYIAEYLYHGLDRHGRAIEILFSAHGRGILDEEGQSTLVQFLHWRNRHGESIALLEPLVRKKPDNLRYRVWLMHAYFRTDRKDDLLALLEKTDAYFHEDDRWQESAMASLGESCLENELFEQSAAYYNEAIPLHQRTQPRRGVGGRKLSEYYQKLARAYAGLGKTVEAVEAAGGAIVSWGFRHEQRQGALNAMRQVLREARNLDAYVAHLDKETAESGLDKPIVRKAIGQVYQQKGEHQKAIVQLEAALGLEPNDAETHKALIACYDKKGDKQGAVDRLIDSLQLARRDVARCRDLGNRLEALKRPAEAERAYTAIVEMLPNESESHAMLAEVRQGQDRWEEAVNHWRQVARIRALEPTGLLKLAAAQIHLEKWDDAAGTLQQLRAQSWPPRFGDVDRQIRDLERQVDEKR
ncbi:MAG: VIT domain-containing protein [Planctomycetota bacterium]|jgi:predicted Zn-dependent protease